MEKEFEIKVEDLQTLSSGAKRDNASGKGAFELVSTFALTRLAKVYEKGAIQKGYRNWEKGFNFSRATQSALRHINQFIEGEKTEDHLAQACWNLFAIMHFQELIERNILPKDLNDMPDYEKK
jgi:hypothetical protein